MKTYETSVREMLEAFRRLERCAVADIEPARIGAWASLVEGLVQDRRRIANDQREACAKAVDMTPEDEADFKRLAAEVGAITDRSNLDDTLATIRATPLVVDLEPPP